MLSEKTLPVALPPATSQLIIWDNIILLNIKLADYIEGELKIGEDKILAYIPRGEGTSREENESKRMWKCFKQRRIYHKVITWTP